MPERSPGSDREARLSSTAPRSALRRLRVLSSGRWRPPTETTATAHAARLIALTSALPGIGKSVIASNLAAALAGLGREVVLADLDTLMPRQHLLFGLPAPATGLADWLNERRLRTDATPSATKVRNLRLLPCAATGDERGDATLRRGFMRELAAVDGELVVVDVGTTNRHDLLDGFATRAHRLVVTGLDQEALEATYALLATAVARAQRRHGRSAQAALDRFRGGLIGNRAASAVDIETLHAFARVVREHLNFAIPVLGCVQTSERIVESIGARQPLVTRRGLDQNVRGFYQLAELLLADDVAPAHGCALEVDEPVEVPVAPLPVPLSQYERKFPRLPVDWTGTAEFAAGSGAVRIRDVSESGVGIETTLPLRIGEIGRLQLNQLPGAPVIAVQVKNLLPALRRAGLGFVKRDRSIDRITAAARRGS
jgi:MinD-like ATPase involved in chromosome partitioning or flagellar assembly